MEITILNERLFIAEANEIAGNLNTHLENFQGETELERAMTCIENNN